MRCGSAASPWREAGTWRSSAPRRRSASPPTHCTGSPRPLRARPSRCWPVTIVEGAVVADQFGLCGDGRLLVALLRPIDEVFERGQAWHARRAALIRVQVYESARVRHIEDRAAKIGRLCLCKFFE